MQCVLVPMGIVEVDEVSVALGFHESNYVPVHDYINVVGVEGAEVLGGVFFEAFGEGDPVLLTIPFNWFVVLGVFNLIVGEGHDDFENLGPVVVVEDMEQFICCGDHLVGRVEDIAVEGEDTVKHIQLVFPCLWLSTYNLV